MKSIDVLELKEELKNKRVLLLDVREQHEIDFAKIKGSIKITLQQDIYSYIQKLLPLKLEDFF